MEINNQIPEVFEPLLAPARYKGAWGGRGSGKSWFFGGQIVMNCLFKPGLRVVCVREIQKTLKDSSKKLIEDVLTKHGLGVTQGFQVLTDQIRTPGGGIIIFMGMQDASAENIKSLEGFNIAWIEEAQTLSSRSLMLLRPTIREEGSELWFSWNARRKHDPVDMMLRGGEIPTSAVVVKANWRDNPFFPSVLEEERKDCMRIEPDQYDHIWEGGYLTVLKGAYYATQLQQAKDDRRIGRVAKDDYLPLKAACDIGGTGAKSDAFTMWIFQNVGKEIRVLDYYEAVGQPIEAHLSWLRERGYTPTDLEIYLPHDGKTKDRVFSVSYESAFSAADYRVDTIPNQGAGAAMARIEVGRKQFGSCWFNEDTTIAGLEAVGWYHEKIDEVRQVGLGPDHDWSSHGADSFGLMCIVSQEAFSRSAWSKDIDYSKIDRVSRCA